MASNEVWGVWNARQANRPVGERSPTIILSPSTVSGTRSSVRFTHYSLLRTTEEMLGLPPLGRVPQARSMRTAFNL